jgi:manganese transport protein
VRRLVTRSLALLPAVLVIGLTGHAGVLGAKSVDKHLLDLLVFSQVILSFQLPFAIVPLVHSTSDRRRMGEFASRGWLKTLAWLCAAVVVGLNVVYIYGQLGKWAEDVTDPLWIYGTVGPVALGLLVFLGYITLYPLRGRREEIQRPLVAPELPRVHYQHIGVAVEFEGTDEAVLGQALSLARAHGAELVAVHVVEGTGAAFYGPSADDQESRKDRSRMVELVAHLRQGGLPVRGVLGYGLPADELIRIAREERLDLLVLGSHGHRFWADLALGRTVSPVLHHLAIPILVVPNRPVISNQ